ncbi:DUF6452 family protein [Polaribacter septentrionalilitoris]|uniref:DUF6452 family protein n=1 Tax=Polaribacter septentrionalilitoris TaxID=2494657 RepID=UPI00135BB605|nr:DUF6452 family protein [Polaribacter septentrionalilitoris]
MRKIIFLLGFVLLINTSCEKDDFCLQNPITPNLIITFYDEVNRETPKNVRRFSIIAQGKTDSLFTNSTSDSIAIPLNSIDTKTVYTLKKNDSDGTIANNQIATFTIEYTPQDEYVSRSCGYRVIFNNITFSKDTNSWIKDFTPNVSTTIDNQNAAHVQIYH